MPTRRSLTVAAAQTGPVLTPDDMRPGVAAACTMVERAAEQGAEVICFSELFLTPFFPNRLEHDFEHWFLTLPDPVVQPLFRAALPPHPAAVRLVFWQYQFTSPAEKRATGDWWRRTRLATMRAVPCPQVP